MQLDRVAAVLRGLAKTPPFGAASRTLLLAPAGARWFGAAASSETAADAAADDLAAALAAGASLLAAERGRSVRIVLSDLWVRYCLIQTESADGLDDAELLALARGQMTRQHPDTAAWPLRVALQGGALLAAACRPEAVEGARAVAEKSGVRLAGIEPLFTHLVDSAAPDVARAGWLLLEEAGLLLVACLRDDGIAAMHAARQHDDLAAAQRLLDRQAALAGTAAGAVWVYSATARPLGLAAPWRVAGVTRY